jgi:hypothetical protein
MRYRPLATPDCGPTSPDYAELLAHGFDTWVESWDYEIAEEFANRVTRGQRDAQALDPTGGQGVTIEIGTEEFQVAPFGGSGAKWRLYNDHLQLMIRPLKMPWPVSVRFSSEGLWQVGHAELMRRAYNVMESIGRPRGASLEASVQVSRFDYCFDFYSPAFTAEVKPEIMRQFVLPGQAKWALYGGRDGERLDTETIRIGKLPRLQIEVYNKAREVTEISGKDWFWKIWGLPDDVRDDVWRVECRFGSEYLKDRNVRSISELTNGDNKVLKELVCGALTDRRLTVGDETRVRRRDVHPLWYAARQAAGDARIAPAVGRLTSLRREALMKALNLNIAGTLRSASVAAIGAYDGGTVDELLAHARGSIEADPLHEKKIDRAQERYASINREDGE